MQDARHFRSRSDLYFELARLMSLRCDAEYCRATAERHLAAAIALEHAGSTPVPAPCRSAPESADQEHGS